MKDIERTFVYVYGFAELTVDTKPSHLVIETGQEILENNSLDEEPPRGTIKAYLQNQNMKVFKVFRNNPLITLGDDIKRIVNDT